MRVKKKLNELEKRVSDLEEELAKKNKIQIKKMLLSIAIEILAGLALMLIAKFL